MKKSTTILHCSIALMFALFTIMLSLAGCDQISAPESSDTVQSDTTDDGSADSSNTDGAATEDTVLSAAYDAAPAAIPDTPQCRILWSATYGGEKSDSARSVAPVADGSLGIAGYTRSSGAGVLDFLAMKLDANGATLWSKTFGNTDNELSYSMTATADGGFIMTGERRMYSVLDELNLTPSYRYNIWIIKLDANGNKTWDATFGGDDYDAANSIAQCADGGYVVAGYTQSYGAEYDPEPHAKKDLWVIKIDSGGKKVWETLYGGQFSSENAQSIRQCKDGGYIVAGFKSDASTGNYDCLLLKLDASGAVKWSRTAGGARFDKALDVIETASGDFISVGETMSYGAGNSDYYVLCYSGTGTLRWSKTFGGTAFDRARSIVKAYDGNYIIAGYTASSGAGNKDMWLVKMNTAGAKIWDQTLGGASCDEGFSIVTTTEGNYAAAGNTSSFGEGELDCWVVKFAEVK